MSREVDDPTPRGRVVVVEADSVTAILWTRTLQYAGHHVRIALDAGAAMAVAGAFRPHVAVLDIELPGTDGRALGGRLRALDPDLAIVLVTSHEQQLAGRLGTPWKVAAELLKPVGVHDLGRLVRVLVRLRLAHARRGGVPAAGHPGEKRRA